MELAGAGEESEAKRNGGFGLSRFAMLAMGFRREAGSRLRTGLGIGSISLAAAGSIRRDEPLKAAAGSAAPNAFGSMRGGLCRVSARAKAANVRAEANASVGLSRIGPNQPRREDVTEACSEARCSIALRMRCSIPGEGGVEVRTLRTRSRGSGEGLWLGVIRLLSRDGAGCGRAGGFGRGGEENGRRSRNG